MGLSIGINPSVGPKGFALVATLMLLVLITIVALGLLTLASVELRKGSLETARMRAQSNAKLALGIALGNLQRAAGPDQRVTARAEIEGNATHRKWLGVWRSTRKTATAELPVMRYNDSEHVIVDSRSADGLTSKDLFESWLVSGGDSASPAAPGIALTMMVGPGSVKEKTDEVEAPLVSIKDTAGNSGSYAYWVSDESLKASVNVPPVKVSATTPVMQGGRFGIHELDQLASTEQATDESLSKVVDYRQASLIGTAPPTAWNQHYHSLGSRAVAVLSDPLRGGLKMDLSSFIDNPVIPAKGSLLTAVSESTPLLTGARRRSHGPKMGVLREFARLASLSQVAGLTPVASTATGTHDKFAAAPLMKLANSQPIHPVLACAEIYTRFAYVRGYLTVHLYPRIVLWNPYNIPLAASTYTVDFNISINDSMVIEKRNGTITDVVESAWDTRSNKNNRPSFTLESTAFEAGEALVFSPKPVGGAIAGRATPLTLRGDTGSNILSAAVDPSLLTNYYITLTQLSTKGVDATDLPVYANHNRGAYYWVDMMDWWEKNPDNGLKVSLHLGDASSYNDRMRLPLLQLVDTDNWRRNYEGRFNNGRWRVGGVEPVEDYERTPDLEPWTRGCYGFRYKWWVEKNPYNYSGLSAQRFWQGAVTADYNLRAPYCFRSPFDLGTDNGESHHWYIWGPYAVESQQGLPALSPERAAHRSSGKYRGNPFFGGANSKAAHVYPLFDIPKSGERIVSIGRFQHAQLTPFIWHPTYAVGGSWVPPNQVVREKSGDPYSKVTAAWNSQVPQLPLWMKQDRGRDEVVYDLSYESNHELWDRFFLSGATAVEKRSYAKDPATPLANAKLVATDGSPDPARLVDYHQAASEVMLAGAFNINSTDPAAWRALLTSLRDEANTEGGVRFARFMETASTDSEPTDIYSPAAWTGLRLLNDEAVASLADSVVTEVKNRGPFLSVSDFVNRRLVSATSTKAETGLTGTLQRAIERSGINDKFKGGDLAMNTTGYGVGSYEVGSDREDWASPDHLRESKATGMPSYLQQGDLLQALGSCLVARGDTFIIRAYGEARTPDGNTVLARAWCEAEVQRMPSYINPADSPEQPPFTAAGLPNPAISPMSSKYGRQFQITSFRWLAANEV